MVSPELVEELRVIIKEEYQVHLEPQDASEVASTLVNYFYLLTKIEFGTEEPRQEVELGGE